MSSETTRIRSKMLSPAELAALKPRHITTRCMLCSNACLLTITGFGNDPQTGMLRRFVTGNRCERGAGIKTRIEGLPNLFAYKYNRLFNGTEAYPYVPLSAEQATRPVVGLPRVLNMYENYPFWFTFFKELGFATVLSEETRKSTYEAGIESMPSESVCYPAKLAHGHIMDLLSRGRKKVAEQGKGEGAPAGEPDGNPNDATAGSSTKPDTSKAGSGTNPSASTAGSGTNPGASTASSGTNPNASTANSGSGESPIDFIFMPCIRYERREDPGSPNHFNCPVVVSYPEVIKLNVEELQSSEVAFLNPFLPYDTKKRFIERAHEELKKYFKTHPHVKGTAPTMAEISAATEKAWAEDEAFKNDIRRAGEDALSWMEKTNTHGIVLAGRPYHIDPEINHAIPELVTSFGLAVLTEDAISHIIKPERPLRVVDQWMYHSRLYAAAKLCTLRRDLDLIQLNSFGCGLDAVTTDQVQEILEQAGKIYTVLKIDEVSNLGAARIRVRSLLAALREQKQVKGPAGSLSAGSPPAGSLPAGSPPAGSLSAGSLSAGSPPAGSPPAGSLSAGSLSAGSPPSGNLPTANLLENTTSTAIHKPPYTMEMKEQRYTILSPQMAPIHFELLVKAFEKSGFNLELLPSVDPEAVEAGLRFTNNDICYPSILVTGQIMNAITSGRYDINKTAVIITQTGGGCRATNYIGLIRKALREAGHPQVPVIALSFHNIGGESNPGFSISADMLYRAIFAFYYGDLLMTCLYRTRPYEKVKGSADALFDKWMKTCGDQILGKLSYPTYMRSVKSIVREFDELELVNDRSKPRVGVVGEILVKFHPTANNNIVKVIESEGCEVVVPGLTEFFLFGFSNALWQRRELSKPLKNVIGSRFSIGLLNLMRRPITNAMRKSKRFEPPASIYELAAYAREILSLCNSMGEGWLLTAEMLELIHAGTPNIVCTQPFACLPNHVTGKGVIKELRRLNPSSNIVAVDYDPGASEVNQLNRIKLMISIAKNNFESKGK